MTTGNCRWCGAHVGDDNRDWTRHVHHDCPQALHHMGYPTPPAWLRLEPARRHRPPLLLDLLEDIGAHALTQPGLLAAALRRHADRLDREAAARAAEASWRAPDVPSGHTDRVPPGTSMGPAETDGRPPEVRPEGVLS